jgi:hypothetical protein
MLSTYFNQINNVIAMTEEKDKINNLKNSLLIPVIRKKYIDSIIEFIHPELKAYNGKTEYNPKNSEYAEESEIYKSHFPGVNCVESICSSKHKSLSTKTDIGYHTYMFNEKGKITFEFKQTVPDITSIIKQIVFPNDKNKELTKKDLKNLNGDQLEQLMKLANIKHDGMEKLRALGCKFEMDQFQIVKINTRNKYICWGNKETFFHVIIAYKYDYKFDFTNVKYQTKSIDIEICKDSFDAYITHKYVLPKSFTEKIYDPVNHEANYYIDIVQDVDENYFDLVKKLKAKQVKDKKIIVIAINFDNKLDFDKIQQIFLKEGIILIREIPYHYLNYNCIIYNDIVDNSKESKEEQSGCLRREGFKFVQYVNPNHEAEKILCKIQNEKINSDDIDILIVDKIGSEIDFEELQGNGIHRQIIIIKKSDVTMLDNMSILDLDWKYLYSVKCRGPTINELAEIAINKENCILVIKH